MESTEPRLIAVVIGVAIIFAFLVFKILAWAYHSLFGSSPYSRRHESEEDKIARVFFDEREDQSDHKKERSTTTEREEWRKVASYNKAIAGKTLHGQKNVRGEIYGLESDDEYFYLVRDCARDLDIDKFRLPEGVTEDDVILAFKQEPNFISWLKSKGCNLEIHHWYQAH